MPYTFEFEDGTVRRWDCIDAGATATLDTDYTPTLYVAGPADPLAGLADHLGTDPKVCETTIERHHTSLHAAHTGAPSRVLAVTLERVGEVRQLAREIRSHHERDRYSPGTFRLFDVDLAPGFRYCLDRGLDPTPSRDLRPLSIGLEDHALADRAVETLRIEEATVDGGPAATLRTLADRLDRADPDVLVLSHGELVPVLTETARENGVDLQLGRQSGWTQLAGASTYTSYGRVGHAPARYRVPGRAIVDTSNSFLWHQSGLEGLRYMVEETGRPLQEAAWGSIGTLLTARQIRFARRHEDILAPWNKWEPERFTDVSTLHAADRGGFTFAPEVGLHETVHEIDFASLYPRIIQEYNISPETVGCACDREPAGQVPELDYPVCGEPGFLPRVLAGLLTDRASMKAQLAADPEDPEGLRAAAGAIKWVLVSCFGYQGYRNAKFGRIECHEAINAHARQILLDAKVALEAAGWRIVHGIVDSLWVTPGRPDPTPLETVITGISDDVGIPLEHDGTYEWVCFVPLREATIDASPTGDAPRSAGPAGALTRYFGKRTDGSYKFRGIELRQRSTPPYVAESQRAFVETLDRDREPAAVADCLVRRIGGLQRRAVDPEALVVTKRVSKPLADYRQETRTVGALRRYADRDVPRQPGQSVQYLVVDDDATRARDRIRLPFELPAETVSYDTDFYAERLVRAAESVTAPLGWDRERLRRHIGDGRPVSLGAFADEGSPS